MSVSHNNASTFHAYRSQSAPDPGEHWHHVSDSPDAASTPNFTDDSKPKCGIEIFLRSAETGGSTFRAGDLYSCHHDE